MQTTITTFDNTAEGWERALYAFLAEKERVRAAGAPAVTPPTRVPRTKT